MEHKIACVACGALILPRTAGDNGGKCIPCARGTRQKLEAGRVLNQKMREERQAYEETAEHKFWIDLIHRASDDSALSTLSQQERTYFLVKEIYGEVCNGGFEQFFTNSGGAHWLDSLRALCEIGDVIAASFLRDAKQLIFNEEGVPTDWLFRRVRVDALTDEQQRVLCEIDRQLWAHGDSQPNLLVSYASKHKLF